MKKMSNQGGFVLVSAVVFSLATVLLGLAYLTTINRLYDDYTREENFFAASMNSYSGIGAALERFYERGGYEMSYSSPWIEWKDDMYYQYTIVPGGTNSIQYGTSHNTRFIAAGRSNTYGWDMYDTVVAEYEHETYADYLYISYTEHDSLRKVTIRFWTPDTLDGKVHSNDWITVMGSPVFLDRVTSCSSYVKPLGNSAIFRKRFIPNFPKIDFPDQADRIRLFSGYRGWGTYDPDSITEITFSGRNIFKRICGPDTNNYDSIRCFPPTIAESPMYSIPTSGAIFIEGKVWVKANRGRPDLKDPYFYSEGFEGGLTIASSDTMVIYDNLVFKHARNNNSIPDWDSCQDVLGLISENYIMVGKDVGDTVYINAALAAINGSISVQDIYMNHAPGWDNEKQSLFIWGSLAQRNRGIVHTTDYPPNHLRGFIEKDYHYDKRLQIHPPPHYLEARKHRVYYLERL